MTRHDASPQRWEPGKYLKFADQRLRPALDLLARVPLDDAQNITDLGCGAGNVVAPLAAAFPGAAITGVDSSNEMLEAARTAYGAAATWVQANAKGWQPDRPQDLIFSNAALHWLDDHQDVFPNILRGVRPGGVLAVQMPDQFAQPSHVLMRETALEGAWGMKLGALLRSSPVASVESYYDWLSPHCESLDIWRTSYIQVMDGEDPVLEWISSTALKPLLEALSEDEDEREVFRDALAAKLRQAYPPHADGKTLFPFTRLFIVARRA